MSRANACFGPALGALAAALALSGCVGEKPGGSLMLEVEASRASTVLADVNEKAQKCWMKSGDRAFRDLALIPELDTRTGKPRLLIVKRGKASGLPQLVIEAHGDPVKISTYGPLAEAPVSARINEDVMAWTTGRTTC